MSGTRSTLDRDSNRSRMPCRGCRVLASNLVSVDQTVWVVGAAAGLALGLRELGRCLDWERLSRQMAPVIGGVLGAAGVIVYLACLQSSGYYASLLGAQRFYDRGHYGEAAVRLGRLLPASTGNAPLMLDIGNAYYAAGMPRLAVGYYKKFIAAVEAARLEKKIASKLLAQAYSGIGAAYDLEGKYDLAIAEFRKAARGWPERPEPWARMAVTYDRHGRLLWRHRQRGPRHKETQGRPHARLGGAGPGFHASRRQGPSQRGDCGGGEEESRSCSENRKRLEERRKSSWRR